MVVVRLSRAMVVAIVLYLGMDALNEFSSFLAGLLEDRYEMTCSEPLRDGELICVVQAQ